MTPTGIAATIAIAVNLLIAIAAIVIAMRALRATRSATKVDTRQDPAHVQQLRASLLGAARRSSGALHGRIVMGRAVRRRAAGGVHVC